MWHSNLQVPDVSNLIPTLYACGYYSWYLWGQILGWYIVAISSPSRTGFHGKVVTHLCKFFLASGNGIFDHLIVNQGKKKNLNVVPWVLWAWHTHQQQQQEEQDKTFSFFDIFPPQIGFHFITKDQVCYSFLLLFFFYSIVNFMLLQKTLSEAIYIFNLYVHIGSKYR